MSTLGQDLVQIDTSDDLLEIDPVDDPLDVDPLGDSFDVDPLDDLVQSMASTTPGATSLATDCMTPLASAISSPRTPWRARPEERPLRLRGAITPLLHFEGVSAAPGSSA